MRRGALTGALALIAGCAGPAIETASVAPVAIPSAWRTDVEPGAPLEGDWWRAFGDTELTTLVDKARNNNSDIAIAAARVRQARAQEMAGRALLFPSLEAGAAAGRSRSVNAFGQPAEQSFAQPQFQAAYEIDLFGRVADEARADRSVWLASKAAHDATVLAVSAAAASGYITLRALDARLRITRETLAARSQALRVAQSRARAGYAPLLELRQAEAEYEGAAQLVAQIEIALARQEDALSQLVGETPHAIGRGKDFLTLIVPQVPDGLPSDLLRRRPDIAAAEYQLAAADASLSAARKRFLPQIRLTGGAGAAFSTLLADPITIWSVGGSVLAPLFEGGRLKAQATAAAGRRDEAAFLYRRAALTAFREVEDNLAAVDRLSEQMKHVRLQRDALASGLKLASNRYRAGYSPYLEQLDAQRGLLAAELNLIQTHADSLLARVALYQAMGGGWERSSVAGVQER